MRLLLALLACAGCHVETASAIDDAGAFVYESIAPIVDLAIPIVDGGIDANDNGCAPGMARIADFCVDRWEATTIDVAPDGGERAHSPFLVIDGPVRAATAPGVVPQGYISQVQATDACARAATATRSISTARSNG